MKLSLLIFLLLFLTSCTGYSVFEPQKEGPFFVTQVIDGDTLVLNTTEHVRLSGINTPEKGECYYQEAKNALTNLTYHKNVYLEKDFSNKDKYGRLLRYVSVDGLSVNEFLIQEGYAKVFDKYANDTKKYASFKHIESPVQEEGKGVWSCEDMFKDCLYVGSKNSKVYHDPSCKYAKRIKPENQICYTSEEEVKGLKKGTC